MASAWSKLSKEMQEASGMKKEDYNAAYGKKAKRETVSNNAQDVINRNTSSDFQEKKVSGTEAANKPTTSSSNNSSNSRSSGNNNNSGSSSNSSNHYQAQLDPISQAKLDREKEYEAKQAEAKERASNYLSQGNSKDAEYDKILKEGGLNNHSYQQMVRKDQKAEYDKAQDFRKESAQAYGQSRLDFQAEKLKHGPAGVYGMQSALENQSVDKVGAKFSHSPEHDDRTAFNNALVRTFQNSGYDYNYDEVSRSKNQGQYNPMADHLYDQYGGGREGWKNWYDNHSIYGGENGHDNEAFEAAHRNLNNYTFDLGNFTGSKDIMEFDKVMEIGQNQQNAMQNYRSSEEYKTKYGQYDWAYK